MNTIQPDKTSHPNRMERFISRYKKRMHFLFYPFLKILFAFVFGYNFIGWLIGILTNQVSIKELTFHLWLLPLLVLIAHIVWLRPRIRLYQFKWYRWRRSLGYHLVPLFLIIALTALAQDYLDRVTTGLTELKNIDEITEHRKTKFYTLKEFYFDKSIVGMHTTYDIERDWTKKWYRKSKVRTNLNFYILVPILANIEDTVNKRCSAWLAVKTDTTFDHEITNTESKEFSAFRQNSVNDFHEKELNQFIYLDKIRDADLDLGYEQAIQNCSSYSSENAPVFFAMNETFDKRAIDPMGWFLVLFVVGCPTWLIMIMIPKLEDEKVEIFEQNLKNKKKKKENHFDGSSSYRK